MTNVCKGCSGNQIEYDPNQGNAFCVDCGTVFEENTIVAEVTFGETSSGAAVLQGQFVSADKGKTSLPSFGMGKVNSASDFRDITIANAKKKIKELAAAVKLSDHHVDMAHRWYILALQHNFTRGRKIDKIAAACLYIVCRQEKTPHMLIDFSDILRINVFVLGGTFLKLVHLLNLELPLIDPSLYINRFAAKLSLGQNTQVVSHTALRIVSRMKRDWIVVGRRPAGICGAALFIAAKMYKFEPSVKEIVSVVRICESTIKKRLDEYKITATSKLSFEQFHEIWLEDEADPPSFSKTKKKEHLATTAMENEEEIKVEKEVRKALEEIEKDKLDTLQTPLSQDEEEEDYSTDEEIESILLAEDAVKFKTQIWMTLNSDYLAEQELKKESMIQNAHKPKQTRKRAAKQKVGPSENALEATKQILSIKKLSKKINYNVLNDLFEK